MAVCRVGECTVALGGDLFWSFAMYMSLLEDSGCDVKREWLLGGKEQRYVLEVCSELFGR